MAPVNKINFHDTFVVFNYPKDPEGGVLTVFAKPTAEALAEDRDTTPEENELAERLFEIHFRTPEVVQTLIDRLTEVKEEFSRCPKS